MSALKPIENTTRVRGVPSKRYPPNTICAHPECSEPVESNHHIFGRPRGPDSDSWFVSLYLVDEDGTEVESTALPHVTGLCGSGTTKHHGDLEEHRAWIKYENGEFVWYDRVKYPGEFGKDHEPNMGIDEEWVRVGPLNPQPGEPARPYKRPKRKQGEGPVTVFSLKAPEDDPEAAERLKEKTAELKKRFTDAGHKIGNTVTVERAIDYTLLNSGPGDF